MKRSTVNKIYATAIIAVIVLRALQVGAIVAIGYYTLKFLGAAI